MAPQDEMRNLQKKWQIRILRGHRKHKLQDAQRKCID